MRYIICFILIINQSTGRSQPTTLNPSDFTKIVDILPPSPNAAALGKFGGIDVGLSSGMSNINVPIYEYRSNNLSLPVSLTYSSNGFRVDEIGSDVGIGWNLNAGGVIARTVFGGLDAEAQKLVPPSDYPQRTPALLNFLKSAVTSDDSQYDSQPDVFSFNFNGYSGKFILDNNLQPVLLTYTNLKIETSLAPTSTAWNIKITTPDGIQYLFGGDLATEYTNKMQTGGCGKIYPTYYPTAYLSKKNNSS